MCTDKLCATKLWGAKQCAAKKIANKKLQQNVYSQTVCNQIVCIKSMYSKKCANQLCSANICAAKCVQQQCKQKNCAEHNWVGPRIATFRVRLLLAPASSACLASSVVCCRISRGHPPTSRSLKPPLKSCNEKSWHTYQLYMTLHWFEVTSTHCYLQQ